MTKPLTLTTPPNINDPRVRRAVIGALEWCEPLLTAKWPKRISSGQIRKALGNTSSNRVADWLKANLLTKVGGYEVGVKSNSFRLNTEGFDRLHVLLGLEPPTVIDVLRRQYADVLAGAELEYKDTGTRRYNDFQNIRRDDRRTLCEGWWDYDIETCAPTLVHQYAVEGRRTIFGEGPEPFPAVARLVSDKAAVRAEVMALAGLSLKDAKGLLTMLFFRANTSPFPGNAFFSLLRRDPVLRQQVLDDPFISQFRMEVELIWMFATSHNDREYRAGRLAGHKLIDRQEKPSKRRMQIYLELEREVINVIEEQLAAAGTGKILMHDGFMSRQRCEVSALEKAVKDRTSFDIRISEQQLIQSVEQDADPDVEEVMHEVECDEDEMSVEASPL